MDSYLLSHLRALIFLISALGVVLFIAWANKHREQWLYVVAPVTWLGHIIIFQLCLFTPSHCGLTATQLNIWSSAIRLQGVILVVGCSMILLLELLIFQKWTIDRTLKQ